MRLPHQTHTDKGSFLESGFMCNFKHIRHHEELAETGLGLRFLLHLPKTFFTSCDVV